jgi:hypothetical protein
VKRRLLALLTIVGDRCAVRGCTGTVGTRPAERFGGITYRRRNSDRTALGRAFLCLGHGDAWRNSDAHAAFELLPLAETTAKRALFVAWARNESARLAERAEAVASSTRELARKAVGR